MADITKCNNRKCPERQTCYRWTAPENRHWQSWGTWEWSIEDGWLFCEGYIFNDLNARGHNEAKA